MKRQVPIVLGVLAATAAAGAPAASAHVLTQTTNLPANISAARFSDQDQPNALTISLTTTAPIPAGGVEEVFISGPQSPPNVSTGGLQLSANGSGVVTALWGPSSAGATPTSSPTCQHVPLAGTPGSGDPNVMVATAGGQTTYTVAIPASGQGSFRETVYTAAADGSDRCDREGSGTMLGYATTMADELTFSYDIPGGAPTQPSPFTQPTPGPKPLSPTTPQLAAGLPKATWLVRGTSAAAPSAPRITMSRSWAKLTLPRHRNGVVKYRVYRRAGSGKYVLIAIVKGRSLVV